MCKGMNEVKTEITQKILRTMQRTNAFEGTDISLKEISNGELQLVRNYKEKAYFVMQNGDLDFNVISTEDVQYLLAHMNEYDDNSCPFGDGEFRVRKSKLGVKEQQILEFIAEKYIKRSASSNGNIRIGGLKGTLLFLYIFKNTVERGTVSIKLRDKVETLEWVMIGPLLMFSNGFCITEGRGTILTSFVGGVGTIHRRGFVSPTVSVTLTGYVKEFVDKYNIDILSMVLERGVLFYALFNKDVDAKSPYMQFGATNKYSVGIINDKICDDYSRYLNDDSKLYGFLPAMDGYLGTLMNVDNYQVVYTDTAKDSSSFVSSVLSLLVNKGLIDTDERFDGIEVKNYLDFLGLEDE